RVVRSSQTREEITAGADGNAGTVSVGNELPGANTRGGETTPQQQAPQQRDQNRKSEEIVNYEISRTTKTEVIEGGRVNRISVAVLVDGSYSKDEKGEAIYKPRSKEELDTIASLVRSAIGFNQKRGDQVEIVNLRFADAPVTLPPNEPEGWLPKLQFTKDDVMNVIELGAMTFLGLIVLFTVVRPLVRRVLATDPTTGTSLVATNAGAPAVAVAAAGPPQITSSATAQ